MQTRSLARWSLAALSIACGGPAVAQQTPFEHGSAVVHRLQPAQAAFAPSIVRRLNVPPGFRVSLFASGLGKPHMLEEGPTAPSTSHAATRATCWRCATASQRVSESASQRVSTFASGLKDVNGIALMGGELLLASSTTIWRTPLGTAAPRVLIRGLPDAGQHQNRMVRVAPDGTLAVSVGSSCNNCAEGNQLERATLIRYSASGERHEVIAKGLRNTIGYDWHPVTGAPWGMDQGSDFRGDWKPPEDLNLIQPGKSYGWPICWGDRQVDTLADARPSDVALRPGDPKPAGKEIPREDFCARTEPPVLTLPAHSSPLAMRFYRGASFPAEMRHGSVSAQKVSTAPMRFAPSTLIPVKGLASVYRSSASQRNMARTTELA